MSQFEIIIRKNRASSDQLDEYREILNKYPLSKSDIEYFEKVIFEASKSDTKYDGFPDNGGIDIAAILLLEIKRRDLDL